MKYDFEQIRDEVEKEFSITGVNEAIGRDPELFDSFTKQDRGIKAMQIVDQTYDGQTNQIDINRAIKKTNKAANKETKRESAAKDLIKSFLSEGYYGYMLLRKAIGHKLEHPVLRPWYAGELSRIPSLVNPGGKVYLTEGSFSITAQIAALNNLVFEGSGWQHTKLLMDANTWIIDINGNDSITIKNMEIDGNSRAYTGANDSHGRSKLIGDDETGSNDITIDNIYMHSAATDYGIELWNTNRLKILDSRFTQIGQSGSDSDPISIQGSTDVRIDGNDVYDSVYEYRAGGIEVQDVSKRALIINNFLNKLQSGIVGSVHSAGQVNTTYIIANNILTDIYNVNGGTDTGHLYPVAIRFAGGSGTYAENVVINNNLCEVNVDIHGAYWNGGIVVDQAKQLMIANNTIDCAIKNGIGKGNYGIEVNTCVDAKQTIANNVCVNCHFAGIKIATASTSHLTLDGNLCMDNDRGIWVTGGDYIRIMNNIVDNNTTEAITIASGVNLNGLVQNNPGYNPTGNFSAPSVPASTTAYTNQYGYPCMVSVHGGTVTEIAVDGVATGQTFGAFMIAPGETITLTYSGAPTWIWYGL